MQTKARERARNIRSEYESAVAEATREIEDELRELDTRRKELEGQLAFYRSDLKGAKEPAPQKRRGRPPKKKEEQPQTN